MNDETRIWDPPFHNRPTRPSAADEPSALTDFFKAWRAVTIGLIALISAARFVSSGRFRWEQFGQDLAIAAAIALIIPLALKALLWTLRGLLALIAAPFVRKAR